MDRNIDQELVSIIIPTHNRYESLIRAVKSCLHQSYKNIEVIIPNHSYLSQLDVTYKTPDLMSHFLPPH
ncbi:glycosyltransferase, partial [Streptococcus pneumoniae]|uniref:glycosyltransferase n=1 Tax=Streptococcus pneumoniae TaxID=1313 RepID=UPI000683682B